MKALKIGAFLCVVIGVLVMGLLVFPKLSLDDYIVTEKHIGTPPAQVGYFVHARSSSGFDYEAGYSASFYNAALPGDHLRSSVGGYSQLLRDGKVIEREVSFDLILIVTYALLAFLPLAIFVHLRNRIVNGLVVLFAGAAEMLVMSGLFYYFFLLD